MDGFFELIQTGQQGHELERVLECNKKTEQYGLVLTQEDATKLLEYRKSSLKDSNRIEFGKGVLPLIIDYFCDSGYVNQENYADTMSEIQEIFYTYKNEAQNELTDEELLSFMRRQYDEVCFGDIEYLRNTCLERYTRATRSGFHRDMQSRLRDEYTLRDTENEYSKLSEETRWDYDLYKLKLEDMY